MHSMLQPQYKLANPGPTQPLNIGKCFLPLETNNLFYTIKIVSLGGKNKTLHIHWKHPNLEYKPGAQISANKCEIILTH